MHTVPVIAQGSTMSVHPAERVGFWEEHNRRHLVGLMCTSYAAEGLWASGVNYEIGSLRLADISGYHGDWCLTVSAGVRHLTRLFALEGTTPARYIAQRRLHRAREQLRDPARATATIAGVAHRWGNACHAHFTRAFRRAFGEAPRDVRPGRR